MDKQKFVYTFLKPYLVKHIRMECSCEKFDTACLVRQFINGDISREKVYNLAVKDEVDRRG